MSKAKKIGIIVCTLVLVLGLVACGSSDPYDSYDLSEYIKLGEYKGLEVEKIDVDITDDQVAEEIDLRLAESAEIEDVTEGKVADGDTLLIDYVGKVDGEEFVGGSAKDYVLTIGSGVFIGGFESGLVGKEIGGDPVVLNLTFPDPYPNSEDLAGKEVEFTVTIKSKQVEKTPTLDEDFVASTGSEAKTVEEYREEVKAELQEQAEAMALDEQKSYLWEKVVADSEVLTDEDGNEKYPQEEVDRVYEETKTQYEDYAQQYEMEFADFINDMMGLTEEEFEDQMQEYAKTVVKQEMVLYAIVEAEDLSITSKEYDEYIDKTLEDMGMTAEDFESLYGESFEEQYGEDLVRRYLYMDKVADLLLENANEVDQLTDEEAVEVEEE